MCSLFFFYQSVGPYTINCDGEIIAIQISLQNLRFRNVSKYYNFNCLQSQYSFRCRKNLFSILHLSPSWPTDHTHIAHFDGINMTIHISLPNLHFRIMFQNAVIISDQNTVYNQQLHPRLNLTLE